MESKGHGHSPLAIRGKQYALLGFLAAGMDVKGASKKAGVAKQQLSTWLSTDADFQRAFHAVPKARALEYSIESVDALAEIQRRALAEGNFRAANVAARNILELSQHLVTRAGAAGAFGGMGGVAIGSANINILAIGNEAAKLKGIQLGQLIKILEDHVEPEPKPGGDGSAGAPGAADRPA